MIYDLDSSKEIVFPDPRYASEEGLLAVGGDLTPERIVFAYKTGIFPWFSVNDPICWWSPDPRFILLFDDFKISKSLQKVLKKNIFEVKYDTNFENVIKLCAHVKRKDEAGTWITDDMINAYTDLHKRGYAHSVETYLDGELVGGLYGIQIGKMFAGESMFSLESNASKVAFVSLVQKLKELNYDFIDCQIHTDYLASFGARNIKRTKFLKMLKKSLEKSK